MEGIFPDTGDEGADEGRLLPDEHEKNTLTLSGCASKRRKIIFGLGFK